MRPAGSHPLGHPEKQRETAIKNLLKGLSPGRLPRVPANIWPVFSLRGTLWAETDPRLRPSRLFNPLLLIPPLRLLLFFSLRFFLHLPFHFWLCLFPNLGRFLLFQSATSNLSVLPFASLRLYATRAVLLAPDFALFLSPVVSLLILAIFFFFLSPAKLRRFVVVDIRYLRLSPSVLCVCLSLGRPFCCDSGFRLASYLPLALQPLWSPTSETTETALLLNSFSLERSSISSCETVLILNSSCDSISGDKAKRSVWIASMFVWNSFATDGEAKIYISGAQIRVRESIIYEQFYLPGWSTSARSMARYMHVIWKSIHF